MKLTYKNRPVYAEVDYSGAACDSFIGAAYYEDKAMEDLTEDELEELTDIAQEKLAEYCMNHSGYWRE